jgi:hypothetical protein
VQVLRIKDARAGSQDSTGVGWGRTWALSLSGLLGVAIFLGDEGYPGPLGLVAFVGIKFVGYLLAGIALKKSIPASRRGRGKDRRGSDWIRVFAGNMFLVSYFELFEFLGGIRHLSVDPIGLVNRFTNCDLGSGDFDFRPQSGGQPLQNSCCSLLWGRSGRACWRCQGFGWRWFLPGIFRSAEARQPDTLEIERLHGALSTPRKVKKTTLSRRTRQGWGTRMENCYYFLLAGKLNRSIRSPMAGVFNGT